MRHTRLFQQRRGRRIVSSCFAIALAIVMCGCETAAEKAKREREAQETREMVWFCSIAFGVVAGAITGAVFGAKEGWNQKIED